MNNFSSRQKAYLFLGNSLDAMVQIMSSMIDMRLNVTSGGSHNIALLSRSMAEQTGLDEYQQKVVYYAALLHNLGLIGLPDELLKTPYYALSETQQALFNESPLKAHALCMSVPALSDVGVAIRHQYERYDGSGYPDRLRGEEIPIESRIISIAVDFHELQNGLYFTEKLSRQNAAGRIKLKKGIQYDPDLVEFFESIEHLAGAEAEQNREIILTSEKVKAGMILTRDLKVDSSMIMLSAGRPLTEGIIQAVIDLENSLQRPFLIYVENQFEN